MEVKDLIRLFNIVKTSCMTNRQLGLVALAGAPALFIGGNVEYAFKQLEHSWFTGVWGIVYISAWMFGLLALYRMRVAGDGFGKWLMRSMFVTLSIANISNFIQAFALPLTSSDWFFYLDIFWPLSHALMLVLGITVLFHKRLDLSSRRVLFIAGLWLPIGLFSIALFGKTFPVMFFPALYNAIMWSLMAFVAIRHGQQQTAEEQTPDTTNVVLS